MIVTTENVLLVGSLLLIISILAGKTSYRFGVPTLIFFLAIGMLAGSEGIGGIYFDDPKAAKFVGIMSLNFILFSGGLDTSWPGIRPVLWQGISLSTLGVLLTAVSVGLFLWAISDFTLFEGLLLGAIVSSTDAAAVFSILRSKSLALKGNIRSTLELESGSNDPMAYFLTIAMTALVINEEQSVWSILPMFFRQVLIGGLAGFIFGILGKYLINRIKLDFEGLYPVLMVALMFLIFSATDFAGGNGFLAVYLAAVYLGNQELIHKKTILKFFDGVAWLMQIVLFVTLGLLVFPSHVIPVIGLGLLISVFMILVARPLSVFISLIPFRMKLRKKWYISWVGLRGAVPIVFATYPLLAGVEKADMIFNMVFFISITSLIVQGTTLTAIARWLHVSLPERVKPKTAVDLILREGTKSELLELVLPVGNESVGKRIVDLGFPKRAIIAMIKRGENYVTPNGSTVLEPQDRLIILAEDEHNVQHIYESLKLSPSD